MTWGEKGGGDLTNSPGNAILLNGGLKEGNPLSGGLEEGMDANREIHPAKRAGWSRVGAPGVNQAAAARHGSAAKKPGR
jgi:hypothetical protein